MLFDDAGSDSSDSEDEEAVEAMEAVKQWIAATAKTKTKPTACAKVWPTSATLR